MINVLLSFQQGSESISLMLEFEGRQGKAEVEIKKKKKNTFGG